MEIWKWLYELSLSKTIRESSWIFPAAQCIHIYSLVGLIGLVSAFDFRLMGFSMDNRTERRPISEFANFVLRWIWIPLAINLFTGGLMFASHAVEYRNNSAFLTKMLLLLVGIGYHLSILFKTSRSSKEREMTLGLRLLTGSSILLWAGVITASRWIAYKQ